MKEKLLPRVFISYSWTDIDRDLLDYIVFFLNSLSEEKYEIIYDKQNTIGDNIENFIDFLKTVDGVILICTPSYKEKILNREPSGVYDEFKIIMERYSYIRENQNIISQRNFFEILPILFSGDKDVSIPNEISKIIYEDLRGFYKPHYKRNKNEPFIPKDLSNKYHSKLENIASKVKGIYTIKKESYKETWKELFKLLFKESKAEWNKKDNLRYVEQIFVKTAAYKKVRDQEVWFFVGRKGSGKTTLTDILPIIDRNKFDLRINIEAEDIYLTTVYTFFSSEKGFDSDTRYIFPRTKVFQFGWEIFLILASMYSLVNNDRCITRGHKDTINKFLKNLIDDNEYFSYDTELNALFNHSFLKLQSFVNDIIRDSNPDFIGANLGLKFSIKSFREYVIPKEIHNIFLGCIQKIKKNILLSFDGFDSVFDEFRKDSLLSGNIDEYNKRSKFEVNWLSSLILLILNQGIRKNSNYPLYSKMYYCITIPKDRFIEVRKRDRDTFRHFNKFAYIKWSGIELAILLRKRMEELSGIYTDNNGNVEDRLKEIFKKGFPNLPFDIEFIFNNKKYKISLFTYVLRHTFWRPRDILFYFTSIFSLYKENSKKNKLIENEEIRIIIKRTTFNVIESEFINEFNTIILNFSEILSSFSSSKQIISFNEISKIIGNLDFKKHSSIDNMESIYEKIELLYNIGFLGIIVPEKLQNEYNIMKYAFSFNEGDFAFKKIKTSQYQNIQFCIHPIFVEYLELDTSQNEELIMNYDWGYLHKQEIYRNINL